jgi:hypothetical protein
MNSAPHGTLVQLKAQYGHKPTRHERRLQSCRARLVCEKAIRSAVGRYEEESDCWRCRSYGAAEGPTENITVVQSRTEDLLFRRRIPLGYDQFA